VEDHDPRGGRVKSLRLVPACAGTLFAVAIIFPAPALAYLDGGSGSLLFQWLIAGAVAAGFAIRMSWRHITGLFAARRTKNAEDA
jgi:hypothetical protein